MISANGVENAEEISTFKQRYAFAFEPAPATPEPVQEYVAPVHLHKTPELPLSAEHAPTAQPSVPQASSHETEPATSSGIADLEPDGEIPPEILEFFVPEAEEHLQLVQDCLLGIETSSDPETVHRLFRSMHTIKGSAAQVGLQRISRVAHSAEDLIGRVRDGEIKPTQQVIDLCLESVDVIKKLIYGQWPDESTLQSSVKSLLSRLRQVAPGGHAAKVEQKDDRQPAAVAAQQMTASAASGSSITAEAPKPLPYEPSDSDVEPEFITGLRSREPAAVP